MDDGMKQLRVRFAGVGQEDQVGGQTMTTPRHQGTAIGREQMSYKEEYDAAYAATVAAVAYAIAAREQEKLSSQEKAVAEKLASTRKKTAVNNEPSTVPSLKSPPRTGENMNRSIEGSKISRWFSGKDIKEDYDDDDEQGANVSVRRPLKPAQRKPEGINSDQDVIGKVLDSAPSIRKDPSFTKKLPEKKGSKREQEHSIQKATPDVRPTPSFPREKKQSKKFEQEQANQRPPPTPRPTTTSSYSSEAEAMAQAWEKEKLAKIKKQYNETMDTIAEWEAEKKAKARRQMELKEGESSDRKRPKAVEEYNGEMARVSKVAAASRLTAEEKGRSGERKVREKAQRIRATGKLPRSCGCF